MPLPPTPVSTTDETKQFSTSSCAEPIPNQTPVALKGHTFIPNPKLTKRRCIGQFLRFFTRTYDLLEHVTPLWSKLGVITIPALVGLVGLAIFLFIDSSVRVAASSKTELAISGANVLQSSVVRLQIERALYSGYVLTDGAYFDVEIAEQEIITDRAIESIQPLLKDLESVEVYEESVGTLKYLFRGLPEKRTYFRDHHTAQNSGAVFDYFTELIEAADGVKRRLAKEAMYANGALARSVLLMKQSMDLLGIMDIVAERRSLGMPVIVANSWGLNSTYDRASYETYDTFISTITQERQLTDVYRKLYQEQDWERYVAVIESKPSSIELKSFLEFLVDNPHAPALNNTSPEDWYNLCTRVIRNYLALNDEIMEELIEANHAYYIENVVRLVVSVVLIVCFVIPTIIVVAFVCRMIYKPVIAQKRNLRIAVEIAEALYNLNFDSITVVQLKAKPDKDCSQLEKAFKLILENFQSFMPYIPRHLLLRDEGDAEKKQMDDGASVSTVDSSHSSTKGSSRNSHRSQPQSTTTSSSKNSSGKRRRMAAKVTRKTSTIMCIDLNEFTKGASEMNFGLLQSTYAEYLSTVSEMLNKNNGMILSFSGGMIVCAWGAASRVFDQEVKATTMAIDLIRATFSNSRLSFRLRIGIATSECTCGELGNNEMRAFNVIGLAASRAMQLAKLCKHYKCSVLVDRNTYKQVNFTFDVKQVDSVTFEESGLPHESIYNVVQSKGVVENEWMYTMHDSQKKDMFAKYNNAWMYVGRGDFVKAHAALEEFKEALDSMSSDALMRSANGVARLEKIIARGEEDSNYRYKSICRMFKVEDNTEQ